MWGCSFKQEQAHSCSAGAVFIYVMCTIIGTCMGTLKVCPFVRPVVKIKTVCVCTLVKSLTVHLAVS